ncbi:MAG: hypothetical protein ACREN5_10090 [Gemmatimonadales bacterium]
MAADSKNPERRHIALLSEADIERLDLAAELDGSALIGPPGFGTYDPPPPYHAGPPRRLPKELRHLLHLKLAE